MKTIRIGGVPEHFNLPWMHLLESDALREDGLEASWEDYPGGTGALRDALEEGRLDVAVLLTEGAVAAIARGAAFRIVSLYSRTPLIWGVHVPFGAPFRTVEEIRGARYAVSRFGSGSHLMAFALTQQRGWPFAELRFVVVDDLEGAVRAFEQGAADVFLWEKFMTQPLVDGRRFRRVGELEAPWPAFVVCVSNRALETGRREIAAIIEKALSAAARLKADPGAPRAIAARYGLELEDAAEWLRLTRWAARLGVDHDALARAAGLLQQAELIAPGTLPELSATL
jgi:sulfonate transport system substrate-binding protein